MGEEADEDGERTGAGGGRVCDSFSGVDVHINCMHLLVMLSRDVFLCFVVLLAPSSLHAYVVCLQPRTGKRYVMS